MRPVQSWRGRPRRWISRSTGPSPARSARSPGGCRPFRPRSRSRGCALKRALKWLGILVAAIVVLTVVAALALPRLIDTPRVQAMIATGAAQAVGRPVKFESLSVSIFPLPSIELHKLEVAEDPQFGAVPFLTLETGRVYLKLRPLLTGRVEFGDITLERPRIALIQNAEGRLNVASLAPPSESKTASRPGRSSGGATGGAAAAIVSRVKVDKGLITYVAQDRKSTRLNSSHLGISY